MTDQPPADDAELSRVDRFKLASDYLHGDIARDLNDADRSHFEEQEVQLMKHHGIYQQDDRDLRRERREQKLDKAWIFMVRTRLPGGRLAPATYLALDDLCQRRGNDTLRVTTRQGFQFHGVGKENLGKLIEELNRIYVTTLAACGDVARNVMANPVSDIAADSPLDLYPLAERLSRHFLPRTSAYFDVWLNGEKLETGHFADLPEPVSPIGLKEGPEPLYGDAYLPRKFKMGLTWAADNHIDLYTQDIGVEVVPGKQGGHDGFNIIVGGGLGQSHGKEETYPRAGDRFAWVATADDVVAICEAIMKVQRDHGDRTNRAHARMKYLVAEWGLNRFRAAVEEMLGAKTQPARPLGASGQNYRLGWQRQRQTGKWFVGMRVENGRVRDYPDGPRLRSGLRALCEAFPKADLRLTAHHNIILAQIDDADKPRVEAILSEFGISDGSDLSAMRRKEMACPALPTCGLALAEAERYLPSLIAEFEEAGYGDDDIAIRMSGCPNACSRPPSAEIGLMGRAPGKYAVYLGGSPDGARYNWLWRDSVPDDEIVLSLGPIIEAWRENGKRAGESFGDWCNARREALCVAEPAPPE